MPNILFVLYSERVSGAEIALQRLLKGMNNNKEHIVLCSEGDYAEKLINDGYSVFTSKGLSSLHREEKQIPVVMIFLYVIQKMFWLNRDVLKIYRQYNISVLHANTLFAGAYLLPVIIIFRLFHFPVQLIWHNHEIAFVDRVAGSILKYLSVLLYHTIIVPSEATKKTFKIFEKKIRVVPIGIDIREYQNTLHKIPTIRENLFPQGNSLIVIGIFGAISERKGHHLLIQSFSLLEKKYPNIRLLILGKFIFTTTEYRKVVMEKIKTLKNETLRIVDWTNEIHGYYEAIDILVNATTSQYSEPLGTTIIEAMAHGKVVVASRTGGSSEIIEHGIDGILFRPDSVEELTNALEYVIINYSNLQFLKRNAVEKIEQQFTIEQSVAAYRKILIA